MNLLISFYIVFLLSSIMIPVGIRLGRRWGIVDKPDARRIHTGLIPRTGGLAIALGTLGALLGTLTFSQQLAGYLGGGAVILAFGFWDDIRNLNYKIKFLGQGLAIFVFILVSGLEIRYLGELYPGLFIHLGPTSTLVTAFFMLAVINIINLSDGLDGLAGGLSLLILLACALLGYVQETFLPIVIALAVSGALVGFMRFNMHPAQVFMGDTGSQFLGYSIGACLIMLTQDRSIYSPILPLFLLGTPVLDTAMVIYERIRSGASPFKPDRNHLHHKLLRAGLTQEQAVISIYFFHFALILLGFAMRFVKDYLVLAAYAFMLGSIVFFRYAVRRKTITAKSLYSAVKNASNLLFIWDGKVIDVRYCISRLFWKSFFVFFFFFFFINILHIKHPPVYIFSIFLFISLALIVFLYTKNESILVNSLYYLILLLIVYVSVYGETKTHGNILFLYSQEIISITFFILTFLYFGCLILTPEKIPLNALDYILLASICFILVIPDIQPEYQNMRKIVMKSVLLGLALNLIYSRINRNKKYVIFLVCILLSETMLIVLLRNFLH